MLRWCFKMGRMLPLEVLVSAACTEAAWGTHALPLLAEVTRNSPSREDDQERRGKAGVSKLISQFWSQNSTVAETSKVCKSLLQVPACSPSAWEDLQEMWEVVAIQGYRD